MKKTLFVLAGLSVALAGCGTVTPRLDSATPPDVQIGYRDGCSSGEAAAGMILTKYVKNVGMYRMNDNYREGWDAGYDVCKGRAMNIVVRSRSRW